MFEKKGWVKYGERGTYWKNNGKVMIAMVRGVDRLRERGVEV